SMEEERARKDATARAAEEKGGGQASSSHDTTMTENACIMSDGANTVDLMASLMLVTWLSLRLNLWLETRCIL
ncbi:hypothetical protein MKW92_040495, partial [Papaver armeniacum]